MGKQPNVLFFFADDMRFDTIAALGNPHIKTPNLDALVARGTAFTHAHIPGGTSGAVCMPSRAMLHTGRSLFHLEGAGQSIPEAHTTQGEHFQSLGYRTFGTGKWHNGAPSFARSFTDGAEIFLGGMADHWNVPAYDFDPSGVYDATCPECVDAFHSKKVTYRDGHHIAAGTHSSELLSGAAARWLEAYDKPEPFFMYVSYLAPHDPRIMPQCFRDLYRDEDIPLPDNFLPQHPFDIGVHQIRDERLADYPRQEAQVREHQADYYAMISHLDHELGRVIKVLEDRGLRDDTIIVFAGDNGLAVGRHGLFGKQSLYEHSVRVPLIFAGPGIPENERRDAFCYLFDIFPTLCDLIGRPAPDSVEGRSLQPILADPAVRGREELFLAYTHLHRGLRTRRHKLIEYCVRGKRHTQLFDLEEDPGELENLAAAPEHAATVADLRKRLVATAQAWDDTIPDWGGTFWEAFGTGADT